MQGALNKYPKGKVKYFGNFYNIPATVFGKNLNQKSGAFNYSTGSNRPLGIQATGTYGHTIFWKTVK